MTQLPQLGTFSNVILSGAVTEHGKLKGKEKHTDLKSLFLNIPSLFFCIWNSWGPLWGDDVSTSAEPEETGTPPGKFLETAVSVIIGSPLAGFKELSGFSGESLVMPFPSEDKRSSIRKKTNVIIFKRLTVQILLRGQKSPNLQ